jgi:hypothetical protein
MISHVFPHLQLPKSSEARGVASLLAHARCAAATRGAAAGAAAGVRGAADRGAALRRICPATKPYSYTMLYHKPYTML